MIAHVEADPKVSEVMTTERMTPADVVELVVVWICIDSTGSDDPQTKSNLFERDVSSLPVEIQNIIEEAHRGIRFRSVA